MSPKTSIPQRRCKSCGNELPLISEFWHKDKTAKYGFTYSCKECAKARARKYGQDNRDDVLEKHRLYYREHIEERHQYIAENAEYIAAWKREWRAANPDKVKKHKSDSQRRNRKSASVRNKRYAEKYPEKIRHNTLNRIARKKAAPGKYTLADIEQLYENQCDLCAYCGIRLFGEYHVDHVIPLIKGGSNWPDNLLLTCAFCNHSKNAHTFEEWRAWRGW